MDLQAVYFLLLWLEMKECSFSNFEKINSKEKLMLKDSVHTSDYCYPACWGSERVGLFHLLEQCGDRHILKMPLMNK